MSSSLLIWKIDVRVAIFKLKNINTFISQLVKRETNLFPQYLQYDLPHCTINVISYVEGVSKSFRTGRLKRELRLVRLSATTSSCIAVWWVSLVSFSAITLYVASELVFIVVSFYFAIYSVRELWIHARIRRVHRSIFLSYRNYSLKLRTVLL
jgi:hypothetical protein